MFWLISGIFRLWALLILSVVFSILAMIPLAIASFIYSGQWTQITVQQILSLENNTFASALGSVLSDNPLWNLIQVFLGGLIKQLNLGVDMNLFFPDAASFSTDPYTIFELTGMTLFMLIWLRIQMDLLSLFFRFIPLKQCDIGTTLGTFFHTMLNGINFSISLLGAFCGSVLFNLIRTSSYRNILLGITIITVMIIVLGIRQNSASYSYFHSLSIPEEILSGLIKVVTLFVSMYLSYYYFSGSASHRDPKSALLIIGWIAGMHGMNGESLYWRLGGLIVVLMISILVIS